MLSVGARFHERYVVVGRIGSGGMGVVYEVRDEVTARRRALKVMLPGVLDDEDARRRFALEATVAAQVNSEQIVEVFDAGIDEATDCPFLVMELLRGLDLAEALQRCGPFPPRVVLRLVGQLAAALQATHDRGIVHRDIKPDNLFLVRRQDGTLHLRIVDFGIAKLAEGRGAKTTLCVGTPHYMAPEQIRGEGSIDARADLYSLAQVTMTLLLGRPYFELVMGGASQTHDVMMRALVGAQTPPHVLAPGCGVELPERVSRWFLRATARQRESRFADAGQMLQELERSFARASRRDEVRWIGFLEKLHYQVRLAEEASFEAAPPSRASNATIWRTASRLGLAVAGRRQLRPWLLLAGGVVTTVGTLWALRSLPFAVDLSGGQLARSATDTGLGHELGLDELGRDAAIDALDAAQASRLHDQLDFRRELSATAPEAEDALGRTRDNELEQELRHTKDVVTVRAATVSATMSPRLPLGRIVATSTDAARCEVPYYFDERGIKHFRVECVEPEYLRFPDRSKRAAPAPRSTSFESDTEIVEVRDSVVSGGASGQARALAQDNAVSGKGL